MKEIDLNKFRKFINELSEVFLEECEAGISEPTLKGYVDFINNTYEGYKFAFKNMTVTTELFRSEK